jgi:hypothetical protein
MINELYRQLDALEDQEMCAINFNRLDLLPQIRKQIEALQEKIDEELKKH